MGKESAVAGAAWMSLNWPSNNAKQNQILGPELWAYTVENWQIIEAVPPYVVSTKPVFLEIICILVLALFLDFMSVD